MGCGIVRGVPSALPVGINPIEKSARKELLCIAFSSAGTPPYPPLAGEGRGGWSAPIMWPKMA
jgi:hypothetical protein